MPAADDPLAAAKFRVLPSVRSSMKRSPAAVVWSITHCWERGLMHVRRHSLTVLVMGPEGAGGSLAGFPVGCDLFYHLRRREVLPSFICTKW